MGNSAITQAGGNVGIGTATPSSKLQVQTSTGNYGLTQTDGVITVGSYVGGNQPGANGGWFGTRSNSKLFFFTNDSSPLMTLDTTGNVGIGTVNPATKLQVFSTGSGVSAIYGESASGRGVWGKSTGGSRGVYGESVSGEGVFGISTSGIGVLGSSTSGSGVYGETAVSSLTAGGVYGKGTGSGSIGVIGEANIANAVGVFGVSTSPGGVGVYARNLSGGRAIVAEGDVVQSINSNGLVKAMLLVNADATINLCYNSQLSGSAATTLPCGFSVSKSGTGGYIITFPFQVNGRFFSATAGSYSNGLGIGGVQPNNATQVLVSTLNGDNRFYLIVY